MAGALTRHWRAACVSAGLLALQAAAPAALAQPADLPIPAATTTEYPPGVKVVQTPAGRVYAAADGRTLYGMDMRTLLRWAPDPAQYCTGPCAEQWEPLLAPAGAKVNIMYPSRYGGRPPQGGAAATPPAGVVSADGRFRVETTADGRTIQHPIDPARARPAGARSATGQGQSAPAGAAADGFVQPQKAPDWTIIQGPQGPQWVYKGWHVVYIRKGDQPGSTAFDGADNKVWNTLKFVPPEPKVNAPGKLTTVLVDGDYALADADGRVLFAGTCTDACAGWRPLPAALASRGLGAWSVDRSGQVPQWRYNGQPVFVSQADDKISVPAGATILRP